jgi:hypothetical protein
MPVNHYFQGGNGIGSTAEKRLYENLIIEGLKIYGHDCYYMPRTLVNKDLILGEDVASKFNAAYLAEMYFETTEGFAGQQELINKFGLEIREDTTFVISKRRWQDLVDDPATMIVSGRPNEGDIIYMPLMNSFFEIQFVEDQEPFFQLGNLPVYKLRVTRWEYSSERIDTGVSTIDAAEDRYSLDQLAHQMSLENEDGALLLETDGPDSTSNYLLLETYNIQTQSPYASNNDLDQQAGFDTSSTADDILDFTERNPFGEVDF